jgi:hypothetical protein
MPSNCNLAVIYPRHPVAYPMRRIMPPELVTAALATWFMRFARACGQVAAK